MRAFHDMFFSLHNKLNVIDKQRLIKHKHNLSYLVELPLSI